MNELKIAWLSPWNIQSAIAKSSHAIAGELERRGHVVTVFRAEVGEALRLPVLRAPSGGVHLLAHSSAEEIRQSFDVAVAQIGDNLRFHGELLNKLDQLDVVGVFHDAFLCDLIHDWLNGDESALRELTARVYGPLAWKDDEPYFVDLATMLERRPMLEYVARSTVAAVAHGEHYAGRLRKALQGPIEVIPLAFVCDEMPPVPSTWDCMTVGVVGRANANKRIDQVLMAIGASHVLRSRCRVKVIGAILEAERDRLNGIARAVGVAPPTFSGYVSDEDLPWQLRDVDAISCLRNPALEGASASLILAMHSRRPTLVTNHGCYSELPDGVVLKCSPEHEALDVMRHLEHLIRDPLRMKPLGERARELALRRNSPSAYADALVPLLLRVVERRPAIDATRSLASTLSSFGLSGGDLAEVRTRDVLTHLLGQHF